MPTISIIDGYRFHFYASDRSEPVHIHVSKGSGYAKIWLDPLEPHYFYNFKNQDQRKILLITQENSELFKTKWHEYFHK